jgi:hypothetical protein
LGFGTVQGATASPERAQQHEFQVKSGFIARLAVIAGTLFALVVGNSAAATAAPGFDSGPWRIVNSAASGHLMPAGFGLNHQDGILIYAWNETATGDSWHLEWVEQNYYLIRNTDTSKCLKPGGLFDGLKTFVTQATCSNSYEFRPCSVPCRSRRPASDRPVPGRPDTPRPDTHRL